MLLIVSCSKEIKKEAPLFENLGTLHFPVTTNSDDAQKYFDQGLILSFAFNHAEAFRSFREASRLDSNCAMAYWGMALVLGPNINAAMEKGDIPTAYDAIEKAISISNLVTIQEKAYIFALAQRYSREELDDRSHLDSAYAEAMRMLVKKYPDDLHGKTLLAEALMDLHPWDYWEKDGTIKPWTGEILSLLEDVIKNNPDHHGANHLYIHAVEASKNAGLALQSADKLRNLAPAAGHLVHMPSHIYIRVGRYHDGSLANELAVKSDEEYLTQCRQQGLYPVTYYPHNYHFLWATATLEGRKKTAVDAALKVTEKTNDSLMSVCGYGTLQHYYVIPLYAYVRFGMWEEILKHQKPSDDMLYPNGVWHYARGMAFLGLNQLDDAEKELIRLKEISMNQYLENINIWGINGVTELLEIASLVLEGELEAKQKNFDKAISLLQKASGIEFTLNYNEPPDWFYPVRNNLGSVLMQAGKYSEAEKIYLEDLNEYPENGWSLIGLKNSLDAQNKTEESKKVAERFKEAWKYSDIELTDSRIL